MEIKDLGNVNPDQILKLVEENTDSFRWDRANAFYIAKRKYNEKGDSRNEKDMEMEALLFDSWLIEHPPTREVPKIDYKSKFSDDMIEYFKRRVSQTNNAIMKAKYCDVVWEVKKDVAYLKLAIKSYYEACEIYLNNDWGVELSNSLNRALQMSAMIKDPQLITESYDKHKEYLNKLESVKRFRYTLEIIESLLSYRKILQDKIEIEFLINILELGITHVAENEREPFYIIREYLEVLIEVLKLSKDEAEIKKNKLRIADLFEKEGDWKKGNNYNSHLTAGHFYEMALKQYIEIGDQPEKILELKIKMEQANKIGIETEMKPIETEIKMPLSHFEQILNVYCDKSAEEVLDILAQDSNIIPDFEKSKINAKEIVKNSITYQIIPISPMTENVKFRSLSEEDQKIEYVAMQNYSMFYKTVSDHLLNEIFKILLKDISQAKEKLMSLFSNNEVIDLKRLPFLDEAIDDFTNKKYISSMHILIFQIEGILRDMVGKLGLPVTSYRNETTMQIMLDDVIEILMDKGLDVKFLKFIRTLLCLQGDNFRNDTAHGIGNVINYNKSNCQFLIYIIIKLTGYNIAKIPNKTNIN